MLRRLAVAASALCIGCSSGPKTVTPKGTLPALDTSSLAGLTQGPGAHWAVIAAPSAIYGGPLAAPMTKLVPKQGMEALEKRLGFDLRASREAMMVEYEATSFYAVRLPEGSGPGAALDAFSQRLLAPMGKSNPRPDLVRVWGSVAAGTRASAAGMWSTRGDVVVGEGGRFGPVLVAMALATGKLPHARSLADDKSFAPLLAWAKGAEIAALARCPLGEALGFAPKGESSATKEDDVLTRECFAAGLTMRPGSKGKLAIGARVTGAWGKDAQAASDALRATFARIAESDLGRVLGLRDAGVPSVHAAPDAVDAAIEVDADTLASGLRRVLDAEIGAATK